MEMTMTKTAAMSKEATLSAKVAAIPPAERFDRAVNLAFACGDNPTDDQVLEFSKLFFGPNVKVTTEV
jgi:hypothetical protein